jgi:hypothetical protein
MSKCILFISFEISSLMAVILNLRIYILYKSNGIISQKWDLVFYFLLQFTNFRM